MKKNEVRLTQLASAAGCGAKIGPKVLAQVVGKLPKFTDPMLLVGPETSDDAAVYKINDELAMIHTVDFFPPVVDDPYMYGQIAAANALSDVYAMGGVGIKCGSISKLPWSGSTGADSARRCR